MKEGNDDDGQRKRAAEDNKRMTTSPSKNLEPDSKKQAALFKLDLSTIDAIKYSVVDLDCFIEQTAEALDQVVASDPQWLILSRLKAKAEFEMTLLRAEKKAAEALQQEFHHHNNVMASTAASILPTKFTFGAQQPIPPFQGEIVEGRVVRVTRCEGVNQKWTVSLYIRQHLMDQLQNVKSFLQNDKLRLFVTGAPGCGKTCFFWMVACMLVQEHHQQTRVLFVQFRTEEECQIWILENGTMKQLSSLQILKSGDLARVVMGILEEQELKFDVCICDGVKMEGECMVLRRTLNSFTSRESNAKISKLVYVTSLQFRIPEGEQRTGDFGIVDEISFESWREDDYENAAMTDALLEDDPFLQEILRKDWNELTTTNVVEGQNVGAHEQLNKDQISLVLKQKYFYAGGSARFMFDMTLRRLKLTLFRLFAAVGNWEDFANSSVPGSTKEAVNSLMQQFSSKEGELLCIPVSKYVLLRAYKACRSKLTFAITTVAEATGIRPLSGWAFELSQLDSIQFALDANVIANSNVRAVENTKLTFFPRAQTSFDGETFKGDVLSNTVIWCMKWNQGCYDAAFYFSDTLVTLQMTIQDTHSLDLKHINILRSALIKKGLNVARVVHVGIVENVAAFSFKRAVGEGRITRANHPVSFTVEVTKAAKFQLSNDGLDLVVVQHPSDLSYQVFEKKV